jgi:CHAD domain-containing protein
MGRFREIERKFEVEPGNPLPDLTTVDGVATVTEPTETNLEATYFDTSDMRLIGHRTTLRQRTGGADEGWHLKLPGEGDARTEVRLPLKRTPLKVPKPLVKEVGVLTRGRELSPVAVLRTTRLERQLLDENGAELAVVADDTVRAERPDNGSVDLTAWREIEVELVDGDPDLLDAVSRALESAGLRRSESKSKLQRVLGDTVPAQPTGKPQKLTKSSRARDVVLAHLRGQVEELIARDRGARTDEPDAVHKMRVATRRLRSALSTYRPLLDREQTDPIRDELKWLGAELGEPRDAEVMRDRISQLAAGQPDELLLGPVHRRIDIEMGRRHQTAHAALVKALGKRRYLRLLDTLDDLLADPPFTGKAKRKAKRVLPAMVARATRRVDRAVAEADAATTEEERDLRLHEVRKSAKRARYAAESVAPVFGKPARRLAKRMEKLQEVLGEHQDSVVTRGVLRELAVAAHGAGENGFTFGLMYGDERSRGDAAKRGYEPVLRAAASKRVRKWTT